MFDEAKGIELLSVSGGKSGYDSYQSSRLHKLTFVESGELKYKFGDKSIVLHKKEILFIPIGTSFTVDRSGDEEGSYVTLNFSGNIPASIPRLYSLSRFTEYDFLVSKFMKQWLYGKDSALYTCKSCFFKLLSYLADAEQESYSSSARIKLIEPAISYLDEHIFDVGLRIDELSRLCRMSDTYFRNIFILRFGLSPQKYIIGKRMEQARFLLEKGITERIGDIAISVGYDDSMYFSRIFRKFYGCPPSKYLSRNSTQDRYGIL